MLRVPLALALTIASGLAFAQTSAATAAAIPTAPVAAMRPHAVASPAGARNDPYYWLRDDSRKNPEMLSYLAAENAYADSVLKPLQGLKDRIYVEIVGRIKQDDASVPYRKNSYWYYTRYETGREYPIYARRKETMDAPEEVMLDGNAMAAGKGYFQIGNWEVSPDNRLLAWAEDDVGRRQYVIHAKDLVTGEVFADQLADTEGMVWANDSRTLFFVEKDPITLLTKRVRTHTLGTDAKNDPTVYEEKDDSFYMGVMRTRSQKYICIGVSSTISTEQRCTSAVKPGKFELIAPRQRDFKYSADQLGDRWVIATNWNAPNYRVMTVADGQWGDRARWNELVPHAKTVFISEVELFNGFIAIGERAAALTRIRVLPNTGASRLVQADEPAYAMEFATNAEPDTDKLRYTYTSLTTPETTYELDLATGQRKLLKQQPVLGGFDKANYATERVWAIARDSTHIPVSLLHRKDFKRDGSAAMLQFGYGSYGNSSDPVFNSSVLSLVDRGMVFAIAHIRGGQEMGRAWYDDGHLLKKRNTFTDFIDVTADLVKRGYAAPDRVAAMGGSAGGLLMGAVANMAPEKYRAIVAQVPFVDVVTTMLDASIPLTTNEYDEWGNPAQKQYYDYMLSYSPYDNVAARAYPAMYVGTGLWDSQVQYYEPTKWVAKLRATKTDAQPLLLRVNMQAGHGGKSGRFERYHQQAEIYAFLLDQLGAASPAK